MKKGNYKSLREGEGGRYGILSITNPNYEDVPTYDAAELALEDGGSSMTHLGYSNDENFIERSEYISTSPTEIICGELLSALPVKNLVRGPVPASV